MHGAVSLGTHIVHVVSEEGKTLGSESRQEQAADVAPGNHPARQL